MGVAGSTLPASILHGRPNAVSVVAATREQDARLGQVVRHDWIEGQSDVYAAVIPVLMGTPAAWTRRRFLIVSPPRARPKPWGIHQQARTDEAFAGSFPFLRPPSADGTNHDAFDHLKGLGN